MKHTKKRQAGEASMKTPTLPGLITFGMAVAAVALSLHVHAQSADKPKKSKVPRAPTSRHSAPAQPAKGRRRFDAVDPGAQRLTRRR